MHLSTVAKEVLCVPGTSTPSERAFSAAGLVVNQQRAALLPKNVDAILFLNKNMGKLFPMDVHEPVHSMVPSVKAENIEVEEALSPSCSSMSATAAPPLPELQQSWEDY